MYKRGENLKETLRIDMTKIIEKNTNWYATILGFFRDEDTETPGIVMNRLNDFLLTIGKPTVEKVKGYKNI